MEVVPTELDVLNAILVEFEAQRAEILSYAQTQIQLLSILCGVFLAGILVLIAARWVK